MCLEYNEYFGKDADNDDTNYIAADFLEFATLEKQIDKRQ